MENFLLKENTHLVVIKKGESVIKTIETFCKDNNIYNAKLSGLGAVEKITCGYYDIERRVYEFKNYEGLFEVVSMVGNVMIKEDDIFAHLHSTFTDEENNCFGGHVSEMIVGVTLEVILEVFPTKIRREFDDETGLFLIKTH